MAETSTPGPTVLGEGMRTIPLPLRVLSVLVAEGVMIDCESVLASSLPVGVRLTPPCVLASLRAVLVWGVKILLRAMLVRLLSQDTLSTDTSRTEAESSGTMEVREDPVTVEARK